MKKMILIIVSLLLITTPLFGCNTKQETPPPDNVPPDVVPVEDRGSPIIYSKIGNIFAIANESGDRLITFTPIENTTSIKGIDVAIGADNQYLSLEFVKKQGKSELDTGRVIAANFDNMEGYVYNVLEKPAVPNQTYFLSNKEVISEKSLLSSAMTTPIAFSANELKSISDAKGRPAQAGWIMADYGEGIQFQIAVFEPQGQNYLMSMILKTKEGKLKFMDYPAVSDGSSVWRVDDGGTIDPSLFSIRFAAKTDQGFLTIVSWTGAEGENTLFLLEKSDGLQEQPSTAYRYWSPA